MILSYIIGHRAGPQSIPILGATPMLVGREARAPVVWRSNGKAALTRLVACCKVAAQCNRPVHPFPRRCPVHVRLRSGRPGVGNRSARGHIAAGRPGCAARQPDLSEEDDAGPDHRDHSVFSRAGPTPARSRT